MPRWACQPCVRSHAWHLPPSGPPSTSSANLTHPTQPAHRRSPLGTAEHQLGQCHTPDAARAPTFPPRDRRAPARPISHTRRNPRTDAPLGPPSTSSANLTHPTQHAHRRSPGTAEHQLGQSHTPDATRAPAPPWDRRAPARPISHTQRSTRTSAPLGPPSTSSANLTHPTQPAHRRPPGTAEHQLGQSHTPDATRAPALPWDRRAPARRTATPARREEQRFSRLSEDRSDREQVRPPSSCIRHARPSDLRRPSPSAVRSPPLDSLRSLGAAAHGSSLSRWRERGCARGMGVGERWNAKRAGEPRATSIRASPHALPRPRELLGLIDQGVPAGPSRQPPPASE